MFVRTYIRTLFNDIFTNNFLSKIICKIVNFYFKLWFKNTNTIKFSQNMPMEELKKKKTLFFQSFTGDKIDCK